MTKRKSGEGRDKEPCQWDRRHALSFLTIAVSQSALVSHKNRGGGSQLHNTHGTKRLQLMHLFQVPARSARARSVVAPNKTNVSIQTFSFVRSEHNHLGEDFLMFEVGKRQLSAGRFLEVANSSKIP